MNIVKYRWIFLFSALLVFPVISCSNPASSPSNGKDGVTGEPSNEADPGNISLSAPENISIARGTEALTISWDSVEDALSYDVYVDTDSSPAGVTAAGVTGTSTLISGLSNGTDYYVRLKAKGIDGDSGFSDTKAVTTLSLTMINVPAGTFALDLGSNVFQLSGKTIDVTITRPYLLGETQVTRELWAAVMKTTAPGTDQANYPITNVSWYSMAEFCNKLSILDGKTPVYTIINTTVSADWSANGYRLPTEMEWTWAAFGATSGEGTHIDGVFTDGFTKVYPGHNRIIDPDGANIEDYMWFDSNSGNKIHEVKTKLPNELGLYDMGGNAWDWVWDWYTARPTENITDFKGAEIQPPSPNNGKTLKGGAYYVPPLSCSLMGHVHIQPSTSNSDTTGFRLARTE